MLHRFAAPMHFSSIHAAKKKGFVALIEAVDKQETPVPVVQTIRAVFLLAFIYVLTGKLALLLALPPGYASAFFPPAGIAVAAVMTRGPRLLPGVLLGSLALNVMLGFDQRTGLPFAALLAAAAAAVASTLQAWYGRKLLQRWLKPG